MFRPLERVPEPEVMDASTEVEAYASATAQAYLESIDRTFVDHLARLFRPSDPRLLRGCALDVGCGPGQIPIYVAQRWPGLRVTGVDAAPQMVGEARRAASKAQVAASFQVIRAGRDERLPFDNASFDLVMCNSVLHHLPDPLAVLDEIARVAKPQGAVLIRDLRRPAAAVHDWHVRWFGRHYSGEMRRLFEASVRAAYTVGELQRMLTESHLNDGRSRVFRRGLSHLGIERSAI
jgi:ubiquinone/menaquinone biosynthesis C-methylase UbiE